MIAIPAIDVMGGRVVRLYRGDPGRSTVYGSDPAETARRWRDGGAAMLHIVDLDAALGRGGNAEHVKRAEGSLPGLGVVSGTVEPLPGTVKVPHMGWNSLDVAGSSPLLDGVKDGAWAYFVHSYFARPSEDVVSASSDYGVKVPAVVSKKNYFGTQFHPEKSGGAGARMLSNFLRECSR